MHNGVILIIQVIKQENKNSHITKTETISYKIFRGDYEIEVFAMIQCLKSCDKF